MNWEANYVPFHFANNCAFCEPEINPESLSESGLFGTRDAKIQLWRKLSQAGSNYRG